MKYMYILDIGDSNIHQKDQISDILNIKPNIDYLGAWNYLIEYDDNDVENEYKDFAYEFTTILDGKYDCLKYIGINREDITAWFIYNYEYQCNMEFSPQQLKMLGDNGITFCITCYDVGILSEEEGIE